MVLQRIRLTTHSLFPLIAISFFLLAPNAEAQVDDLAFANFGPVDHACLNVGDGTFTCSNVTADVGQTHGLIASDVDGDGDDDLVMAIGKTASRPESYDRLCLNSGGGTFSCANLSADANDSRGVASADFDGDGNFDLVFANGTREGADGVNRLCLNQGVGSFVCSDISADAVASFEVAVADLDGDGDEDVVFANDYSPNSVCLNDGSAVFTCSDVSARATSTTNVLAADLDGDQDADLVFTNFAATDQLCLNDGSASFVCADFSADAGDTYAAAAADVDADGDLDVAFANPISNNNARTNKLCLNDGAAVFSCEDLSLETDHSWDIVAADLDGDGDSDFAIANERFYTLGPGRGNNRVCLNDGSGSFTCSDIAPESADTYAVTVGNFDGDPVAVERFESDGDLIRFTLDGPNPVVGRTAVSLTIPRHQNVVVEVVDLLGRRVDVLHSAVVRADQSLRLEWDTSERVSGPYFVRATGETFSATVKVVVLR